MYPCFQRLQQEVPPSVRWTLDDLFGRFPDLELVCDLTNTTRYYDPDRMRRLAPKGRDFEHRKIFTEGHVVPKRSVVERFVRKRELGYKISVYVLS